MLTRKRDDRVDSVPEMGKRVVARWWDDVITILIKLSAAVSVAQHCVGVMSDVMAPSFDLSLGTIRYHGDTVKSDFVKSHGNWTQCSSVSNIAWLTVNDTAEQSK